jgi:riboflavin kinase/FMN adenylyltransferase
MSGGAFIKRLSSAVNMRHVVVGSDFHCGYRNDTDAATLKQFAMEAGITAEIVPPVMEGGLPVSSSRIRHAIASGKYGLAEALLGRSMDCL